MPDQLLFIVLVSNISKTVSMHSLQFLIQYKQFLLISFNNFLVSNICLLNILPFQNGTMLCFLDYCFPLLVWTYKNDGLLILLSFHQYFCCAAMTIFFSTTMKSSFLESFLFFYQCIANIL